MENKRRFLKEAEMLNGLNVHENIPTFLGYSDNPNGLMMEFAGFDFSPFNTDKVVFNLEDFYHYLDAEFDFNRFVDILPVCIKDTVASLEYLHQHNIAHRDLKPSNVLVSNQHYCNIDKTHVAEMYAKCPIVGKGTALGTDVMKHLMLANTLPVHDAKYEVLRVTKWWQADEIWKKTKVKLWKTKLQKMMQPTLVSF
jgi:serine/threonine protein kinase